MNTASIHTEPSGRLHGLDALRAFALLLGVALHASMSWLPGAQYFWIVSEAESSQALAGLFYGTHLFRMTTFFLLAGFFARLACERLGWWGFARDRCKRIVLPLVTAWPLVFTGIVLAVVWAAWIRHGGTLPQQSPPGPAFTPDDFPLAHLWFLYLLTIFYGVALLLRALAATLDPRDRVARVFDRLLSSAMERGGVLLPALPIAATLALHPGWYAWFGIPTPDTSLYPNLAALVAYGLAFAAGWGLHRQHGLLVLVEKHWRANLALALGCTALCLWHIGLPPRLSMATADIATFGYALGYAIASWSATLALVGLALRHCSAFDPRIRYLADASYWIYLVHLPLVMLLQVAASLLAWPWWIEFPLLLALALGSMLTSYHVLVRHTAIGAWLNGRRVVRGAPAPASRVAEESGRAGHGAL